MNQHSRNRGECKINEAIAEFLEEYNLKDGYIRAQIETIWEKTAGKGIARYTKRIDLKGSKLTIYMTSPLVKKELLMLRSEIILQLNKEIGKELIQEIDIK